MADFAARCARENRSERTIEFYAEAVRFFEASQLTRRRPTEIGAVQRKDIEAFIIEQLDSSKPASAAVRYRSLRAYCTWLAKTGHINPDLSVTAGIRPHRSLSTNDRS